MEGFPFKMNADGPTTTTSTAHHAAKDSRPTSARPSTAATATGAAAHHSTRQVSVGQSFTHTSSSSHLARPGGSPLLHASHSNSSLLHPPPMTPGGVGVESATATATGGGRRSRSPSFHASGASSPSDGAVNDMRPNAGVKVQRRPSTAAATTTQSSDSPDRVALDARQPRAAAAGSTPPPSRHAIIPVRSVGGHWNTLAGGLPYDRFYPGGSGLPAFPGTDLAGLRTKASAGLDWQVASAAHPGSTELHDLLAESQLSTQSVGLRVCDLRSCAAVEHVAGSFVTCPRCRIAAYCCLEHRALAYRSWHDRVCSVTRRKVMKPNQTLRFPVHQVKRLHSGLPGAVRAELLREDEQGETRRKDRETSW